MTFVLTKLIPLAAVVVFAGCPVEEAYDPSAEACEHTQDGPALASTASVDNDSTAPDISTEHTRHDVTLVALDEGNGGFVRFESEGGAHIAFFTKDVPVAFAAIDATPIAIEESVDETTCPEVAVAKHVVLPVGIVSLSIGPTPETTIGIIIERAVEQGGEADE